MLSKIKKRASYGYERVFCKDGFSVSIQGGEYLYSNPRMDLQNLDCYDSLELGFPSEVDELINEFADGEPAIDTVYGYVPKEIVIQLIEKHGGLVESENRLLELAKKMRG